MYGPKIFRGQFSRKFKKSLKIYLLLQFSINLQNITESLLLNINKIEYRTFLILNNKFLIKKTPIFCLFLSKFFF